MNIQVKAGFSVRQANVIPLIVTLFLPGVPVKLTDLSILFPVKLTDLSNYLPVKLIDLSNLFPVKLTDLSPY